MKAISRTTATAALLAGGLLALSAAPAQTPPQDGSHAQGQDQMQRPGTGRGPRARGPMDWDGPGGPGSPPGFGPPPGPDHMPGGFEGGPFMPPPFLAGLRLSDEQQDKVFSILYAAAPRLREQGKALRTAREALMKAGTAEHFDEAAARQQADAAARADSELALLRARTEHQVYEVLTPEQRAQVEKHRGQRGPHGPGEMPPV